MSGLIIPARPDWALLDRRVLAADTSILFPVTDAFEHYLLRLDKVEFSTTARMDMRVSEDPGGVETAARYNYQYTQWTTSSGAAPTPTGGTFTSSMRCTPSISVTHQLHGDIVCWNCGNAKAEAFIGDIYWDHDFVSNSQHTKIEVVNAHVDQTLLDGVQVFPSSGNFPSGVMSWYGWQGS